MEHTLWTWAQHSLQNHLHENAIFLAERLCAEVHTDWAKHLLATCYFQSGAANRAVAVLQASTTPQVRVRVRARVRARARARARLRMRVRVRDTLSPSPNPDQNRYLLALCHVRLGKMAEAQTVLLGAAAPDNEAVAQVPNAAAGLYLMGVICLKLQQRVVSSPLP